MDLLLDGQLADSSREHLRMLAIFKGLFIISNPIPVKYCLNYVGFDVGKPRLPLVEPDDVSASQLKDLLKNYTIDLPIGAVHS